MPYLQKLKQTFERCEIKRVAIVDDAFDDPDFGKLEPAEFRRLRNRIKDLLENEEGPSEELDALAFALGRERQDLGNDLDAPDTVALLWSSFVAAEPATPFHELLRPLFRVLGTDRVDKLRPLRKLKLLIKDGTDADLTEFKSDADPRDLVGFDLVFLDFYLSDDVPHKKGGTLANKAANSARKRSIDFLAELVRLSTQRVPLVMLISSLAVPSDLPEFRREAAMLASKLGFLPKEYAETDPARTQHTIIGLTQHRSEGDALWTFLNTWKTAVAESSEDLMVSLRELDLTDYSYMKEFRLATEKTPLAQYLVWLFSGQLTDLVEGKLHKAEADELIRKLELPKAIPGRVGPTPAITRLYSALITSKLPVDDHGFKPKAWAGDVFLDVKTYNRIFKTQYAVHRLPKTMPQVLAVITPSCDLVPERSPVGKLKTVTMVGGSLVELSKSTNSSNHLLMLDEQAFSVEWNTKWPVTMTLNAMDKKSNLGGRYRWVGRLREMYHADLQHRLLADVGRVGLQVAPTMSEPTGVKVMAKTGVGTTGYEIVFEREADDGSAWTFNALEGKRAFCMREEVAWEIRTWARERHAAAATTHTGKLLEKTQATAFIDELQRPVSFGHTKMDLQSDKIGVKYKRVEKLSDFVGTGETSPLLIVYGAGETGALPPTKMAAA